MRATGCAVSLDGHSNSEEQSTGAGTQSVSASIQQDSADDGSTDTGRTSSSWVKRSYSLARPVPTAECWFVFFFVFVVLLLCRVRSREDIAHREFEAGRVCALESSIKNFVNKNSDVVSEPRVGLSFDSLQEAYDFYNLHSWEVGFGISAATHATLVTSKN